METIEIEIDSELLHAVEEMLKPYGITAAELAEQFFKWCAEFPEEAKEYLLQCKASEQSNR